MVLYIFSVAALLLSTDEVESVLAFLHEESFREFLFLSCRSIDVMAVFLYFRQTINRMIDVKIITISNSAIEASKMYIVVFNCSA